MSIPFTQYMLPNGRKVQTETNMPIEVEIAARAFIDLGGWFESEMLSDYKTVSLTACWNFDDGPNDIAIRVVENGPKVIEAISSLVTEALEYAKKNA